MVKRYDIFQNILIIEGMSNDWNESNDVKIELFFFNEVNELCLRQNDLFFGVFGAFNHESILG